MSDVHWVGCCISHCRDLYFCSVRRLVAHYCCGAKKAKSPVCGRDGAYCRRVRAVVHATEPEPEDDPSSQQITVAELVARIESEGLATRLQWNEGDKDRSNGPDEDDWPTGVLPGV